jgi:signal peptidase I
MQMGHFGVVTVLMIVGTLAALASIKDDSAVLTDGLSMHREEVCTESFNQITCVESTFVECNGDTYKLPNPTGFVVKDKIYIKDEVECEQTLKGEEKASPPDRIRDSDVEIFDSKVVVNLKDAYWRRYIDSNSMDPLIDIGATTIEIKPGSPRDIKVGDIIAFEVEGVEYAFVHRVVEIRNDPEGVFFITKGDNYYKPDLEQIRFSQIKGIVVGILY